MNRHVRTAIGHVIKNRGFLFLADRRDVGVDHQAVVFGKVLGVEVLHVLGVIKVDATRSEGLLELGAAIGGAVVSLVPEKEQLDGAGFRGGGGKRCGKDRRDDRKKEYA